MILKVVTNEGRTSYLEVRYVIIPRSDSGEKISGEERDGSKVGLVKNTEFRRIELLSDSGELLHSARHVA